MIIPIVVRTALMIICIHFFMGCGLQPTDQSEYFSNTTKAAAIPNISDMESGESTATTVYVCNSSGAKKYHYKETCRGLSACKHEIVTMNRDSAENKGLGVCGWEN